jgi:hypothetical protein
MVNFASSIANFAAEHNSLAVLSRFFKPLDPKKSVGLKLLTSPPNLHLNPFVSNLLIGLIPDRPSFKAVQNCSFPIPFGAITPIPVITIRLFRLTHSSIYDYSLACDIARLITTQKSYNPCHFFRPSESAQWYLVYYLTFIFFF